MGEKGVSLWGRLGVQLNLTEEEFDVLQKNDSVARDLLVKLIKSDRCYLSRETYFPMEPNEEHIKEDLEFDVDFQKLQRDEFEIFENEYNDRNENPNILGLRGEISNLHHELEWADVYSPKSAPDIEKRLAIRELELNAALEGVKLSLDPDDIIDTEHLDCFWYDGYIGSLEYKGYTVDIKAVGDVRVSVLSEDLKENIEDFTNPPNDRVFKYFKNDSELQNLTEDGRLYWNNNNWLEFFVYDPEERDVTPGGIGIETVLDDNVLDAFKDVGFYKDVIDKIIEKNKGLDNVIKTCEEMSRSCDARSEKNFTDKEKGR